MLATSVFVRFPSLVLFGALLIAFSIYSCHTFITHPMLYVNYAQFVTSKSISEEITKKNFQIITKKWKKKERNH
ncbi:unnamed protein product [Onchocerca flexuosa]|uniref:Lipoprotein n=1 Tax=Onchocerca flexuosa TaxID=387005 RepID=A0A183HML1_9BILA|nr:unnamed protein product [Onchocerca flexuosa]